MRRKYKMTGCARFFIFLLIFTPIVLIGVSYYNGHNPIQQIKELLNIESVERSNNTENQNTAPMRESSSDISNENILKSTIETQKSTIEGLKKQVDELEKKVKDQGQEIQYLKQQQGNE